MADRGTILWWGRFDPDYSRNRVLRQLLVEQGWRLLDFHPLVSGLGDLQAALQRLERPDLVWVPCFRQRDLAAASRWARRRGIPLIFDPLISAYDKQVDERRKYQPASPRAQRLLAWERGLFHRAGRVVADTPAHADYFQQVLGVPRERLAVLTVGAEEGLFQPCPPRAPGDPLELLFFGSFIPLQGPELIVEAARLCSARNVIWTLLGEGPLRPRCEKLAQGLANVRFEDWLPYRRLPERICQADILLGIFGDTPKAGRVVPNKVYQALACARPVITRVSPAYPPELRAADETGIFWVAGGSAEELADIVEHLATNTQLVPQGAIKALATSKRWFSMSEIDVQLERLLNSATR